MLIWKLMSFYENRIKLDHIVGSQNGWWSIWVLKNFFSSVPHKQSLAESNNKNGFSFSCTTRKMYTRCPNVHMMSKISIFRIYSSMVCKNCLLCHNVSYCSSKKCVFELTQLLPSSVSISSPPRWNPGPPKIKTYRVGGTLTVVGSSDTPPGTCNRSFVAPAVEAER